MLVMQQTASSKAMHREQRETAFKVILDGKFQCGTVVHFKLYSNFFQVLKQSKQMHKHLFLYQYDSLDAVFL